MEISQICPTGPTRSICPNRKHHLPVFISFSAERKTCSFERDFPLNGVKHNRQEVNAAREEVCLDVIDVLPGAELTCINLAPTGLVEVVGVPRRNEKQRLDSGDVAQARRRAKALKTATFFFSPQHRKTFSTE